MVPDWLLPAASALTTPLPTDRGFPSALSACAGLLVEAALAKLRIESRALHLTLESAEGALQALVFLNDDFQVNPLRSCRRARIFETPSPGAPACGWR